MLIVRKFYNMGPCIELGILVSHTNKFYLYSDYWRYNAETNTRSFYIDMDKPYKKISKSKVHTEDCDRCAVNWGNRTYTGN